MNCKRCGCKLEYKRKPPLFCKDCRANRDMEYWRSYANPNTEIIELGTTDFGDKMCKNKNGQPDWDKERLEINAEMSILGLKRTKKYIDEEKV